MKIRSLELNNENINLDEFSKTSQQIYKKLTNQNEDDFLVLLDKILKMSTNNINEKLKNVNSEENLP